ncbi:cold shock-like protein [Bordetella ansorpii]|uniref:Cold shock-like protein n=1 Tax=Bordetella ansorpii TaxID=288768 RepID=A0A157P3E5_9BORD|nr:cold shock and DUF1294 domain-containing protein [Bordetella ansorpii]SAI28063.1 cold shock-like protein [Bordetella ansorpii]
MKGYQEGTLKSWNDERGFGFITPEQGGEAVFAHISVFESGRPQASQRVRFLAETAPDKRLRARKVQLLDIPPVHARGPSRQWKATGVGFKSQLVLALFLGYLLAAIWMQGLPWWVFVVYVVISILTFLVYASDKSSARASTRRIPENTLHMLSLAGGWPGALVAQQVLRHKSSKASFQVCYWITVVLNFLGLALLTLPALRAWLFAIVRALAV